MKFKVNYLVFLSVIILSLLVLNLNVTADSGNGIVTWESPFGELGVTIDVNRHPNVSDIKDINILVKENGALVKNAVTSGTMTLPSGDLNFFGFTNIGDGNYSNIYTFNLNGTYILDANAVVDANGLTGDVNGYIYVGTYSLYISFTGDEYYDQGDAGTIMVYVSDENSNPILYADGNLTIWYPNTTVFADNVSLTELGLGYYYYNFTVPNTAGTYTYTVQINSGTNTDNNSGSFEVSEAAASCGDGTCNGNETCSTCSADCGQCAGSGGGSGGGGGGGGAPSLTVTIDGGCINKPITIQVLNRIGKPAVGAKVILRIKMGNLRIHTADNEGNTYFTLDEKGSYDIWATYQGMSTIIKKIRVINCEGAGGFQIFSVDQDILEVELRQGESESKFVKVTNNTNTELEMQIDLSDLQGFARFIGGVASFKFTLDPFASQSFEIEFDISETQKPGLYTKKIRIANEDMEQFITAVIAIESKGALFDIIVDLPEKYNIVEIGDEFLINITLYNLGQTGRVDAFMTYTLQDIEGNEIFRSSDVKAVETQTSFTKDMHVPYNAPPGKYIIYVEAEYNGTIASATHLITVVISKDEDELPLLWIFTLILIVMLGYLIITTIRSLQQIKKSIKKIKKPVIKGDTKVKKAKKTISEIEGYSNEQIENYLKELKTAYEMKIITKKSYDAKKESVEEVLEKYKKEDEQRKVARIKIKLMEKHVLLHLKTLEEGYQQGLISSKEFEIRKKATARAISKLKKMENNVKEKEWKKAVEEKKEEKAKEEMKVDEETSEEKSEDVTEETPTEDADKEVSKEKSDENATEEMKEETSGENAAEDISGEDKKKEGASSEGKTKLEEKVDKETSEEKPAEEEKKEDASDDESTEETTEETSEETSGEEKKKKDASSEEKKKKETSDEEKTKLEEKVDKETSEETSGEEKTKLEEKVDKETSEETSGEDKKKEDASGEEKTKLEEKVDDEGKKDKKAQKNHKKE